MGGTVFAVPPLFFLDNPYPYGYNDLRFSIVKEGS